MVEACVFKNVANMLVSGGVFNNNVFVPDQADQIIVYVYPCAVRSALHYHESRVMGPTGSGKTHVWAFITDRYTIPNQNQW